MRAIAETPRERPILFSGPMVRAILDGRKTQTRRVMKTQPAWDPMREVWTYEDRRGVSRWSGPTGPAACALHHGLLPSCPYGQPGDRLWVRETWGLHFYTDETDWLRTSVAGATDAILGHWKPAYRADWGPNQEGAFWRPSIHMPRWASRLTLEVTEVRVQRLQDISEEDARAEGAAAEMNVGWPKADEAWCRASVKVAKQRGEPRPTAATDLGAFAFLWDSINAKRGHGWDANPWVWAVSFRRVP